MSMIYTRNRKWKMFIPVRNAEVTSLQRSCVRWWSPRLSPKTLASSSVWCSTPTARFPAQPHWKSTTVRRLWLFRKPAAWSMSSPESLSLTRTHTPDLEEQLEVEAIRQQEAQSLSQEDSEAEHHQETTSFGRSIEGFPPVLPDCMNLPPPEWPDSPLEDSIHGAEWVHEGSHTLRDYMT